MDFLALLNEAQQKAVLTCDGPVMILAGAGSGKTRTLVAKISYLLHQKNIPPSKILALTFSNRAAKEMRDRVARETIAAPQSRLSNLVTTFHSFCAQTLRAESLYLGLTRNFTIYDRSESKALVTSLMEQQGISPKKTSPYIILSYIDSLKNQGHWVGREEHLKQRPISSLYRPFQVDVEDEFYPLFVRYENQMHQSNALDFGGLITSTLRLFETHPEVVERFQRRFQYVLVDEYQDTNKAQFDLMTHLVAKNGNICVVGDEDQSIYSWRGANIKNILDFDSVYPAAQLLKLEQNYRSSKTIIEAAGHVIARNTARKGKNMWTHNTTGEGISVVECSTDKVEAQFVASSIEKLFSSGISLNEIALFYRNNAQSRLIEEALRRKGIPYRVVGGIEFYARKEVKDFLCYLRLVVNPKDSLALERVINTPPRGLGAVTLKKIEGLALSEDLSLWEVMENLVGDDHLGRLLKISRKAMTALTEFMNLIKNGIHENKEGVPPGTIAQTLLSRCGLLEYIQKGPPIEAKARKENLQELMSGIKQFQADHSSPSLQNFLEDVALDGKLDAKPKNQDQRDLEQQQEVSLMTIHGSKGLEFTKVFVIGLEDGIFPSIQALQDSDDLAIEEERRLFYVAMTRAMQSLTLIFANSRMTYGRIVANPPSRFLLEIPEDYYSWKRLYEGSMLTSSSSESHVTSVSTQETSVQGTGRNRGGEESKKTRSPHRPTFNDQSWVEHPLYGKGQVLESHGVGRQEKVLIRFEMGLKKRFMVAYAPLSEFKGTCDQSDVGSCR